MLVNRFPQVARIAAFYALRAELVQACNPASRGRHTDPMVGESGFVPGGAASAQASVLLVDDREDCLLALEQLLKPLGHRLVRACSGEEAMKAVLREEFAAVLLDVMMPDLNGLEVAAYLHRLEQTKQLPIVLVTGMGPDLDCAHLGYSAGAIDYLIKPFDPYELRAKVNFLVNVHSQHRKLREEIARLQ